MNGTKDFKGDIKVYNFRITYGVPSLTSNKQGILIPYNGIAEPALTANITSYDYSMDNGSTWTAMTPSGGTSLTGLSFTPSGASLNFTWLSKSQIGLSMYNNQIRIRLRATSGALLTAYAMYTLYFERTAVNLRAQQTGSPFPSDYSGVPGSDLLENAPKVA
jgi:hypothetical protein